MKAICINQGGWFDEEDDEVDGPKFGEEVTIVRTYYSNLSNGYYHDLKEYPPKDEDDGFNIVAFVLISNLDETKIQKTKKQSK